MLLQWFHYGNGRLLIEPREHWTDQQRSGVHPNPNQRGTGCRPHRHHCSHRNAGLLVQRSWQLHRRGQTLRKLGDEYGQGEQQQIDDRQ